MIRKIFVLFLLIFAASFITRAQKSIYGNLHLFGYFALYNNSGQIYRAPEAGGTAEGQAIIWPANGTATIWGIPKGQLLFLKDGDSIGQRQKLDIQDSTGISVSATDDGTGARVKYSIRNTAPGYFNRSPGILTTKTAGDDLFIDNGSRIGWGTDSSTYFTASTALNLYFKNFQIFRALQISGTPFLYSEVKHRFNSVSPVSTTQQYAALDENNTLTYLTPYFARNQLSPSYYKEGDSIGQQPRLDLQDSTGISITTVNDIAAGRVKYSIRNTAPDQTISISEGTGIDITGDYPSFSISNTMPGYFTRTPGRLTPTFKDDIFLDDLTRLGFGDDSNTYVIGSEGSSGQLSVYVGGNLNSNFRKTYTLLNRPIYYYNSNDTATPLYYLSLRHGSIASGVREIVKTTPTEAINHLGNLRTINTTAPLTGGGTLAQDRTLSLTGGTPGYSLRWISGAARWWPDSLGIGGLSWPDTSNQLATDASSIQNQTGINQNATFRIKTSSEDTAAKIINIHDNVNDIGLHLSNTKGTPLNIDNGTGVGIVVTGAGPGAYMSSTTSYGLYGATSDPASAGVEGYGSLIGIQAIATGTTGYSLYGISGRNQSTSYGGLFVSDSANAIALGIKRTNQGTVKIIPPTIFSDYTLTLPIDDGTANQVLQTNGDGITSWVTPASGNTFTVDGDIDNRILTAAGKGDSCIGEANLTFNGTDLTISGSGKSIVGGNVELTGGGDIISSSNGDIGIDPNGTGKTTVKDVKTVYYATLPSTAAAASTTIDWTTGDMQVLTLGASITTLAFTAPTGPTRLVLKIVHAANTNTYTIDWADVSAIKWQGGSTYALSPTQTSGAVDVLYLFYDGTNYYATYGTNFQ